MINLWQVLPLKPYVPGKTTTNVKGKKYLFADMREKSKKEGGIMGKEVKNGNGKVKLIGGIIGIVVIFGGFLAMTVRSYDNAQKVPHIEEEISEMKVELAGIRKDVEWLCKKQDKDAYLAYKNNIR